MSPGKFSKIYRRRQVPTVVEFIAIARAIHLDPARLFTDGELVIEVVLLSKALAASQRVHEILSGWLPESPAVAPGAMAKPAPRLDAVPVRAAANPSAELVVEYEAQRKSIPRDAWNRGARMIARVDGDSMDGGSDPIATASSPISSRRAARAPRTDTPRLFGAATVCISRFSRSPATRSAWSARIASIRPWRSTPGQRACRFTVTWSRTGATPSDPAQQRHVSDQW